jgi:hypothetical protein
VDEGRDEGDGFHRRLSFSVHGEVSFKRHNLRGGLRPWPPNNYERYPSSTDLHLGS